MKSQHLAPYFLWLAFAPAAMGVSLLVSLGGTTLGRTECPFEWQPLGSGMDDAVRSLTIYGGELIAGGTFTQAGGQPANYIARWDGAQWRPLGSGTNGCVHALAVYNGALIAGGAFTDAGRNPASRIARWDGAQWSSLGSGMNTTVLALTVYNGELIAGGYFTQAGGQPANYIARWDGAQWQPLGSGISGLNPHLWALTVYNGELIAGGTFTQAGDQPANNIARWDGTSWSSLGSGVSSESAYPELLALTVYNGELIAGGYFTQAGGQPANYIARWDGAQWQPLGSGTNSTVVALTVYNGELIAGGGFTLAGGGPATNIAGWDGAQWRPLGGGMNHYVAALTAYGPGPIAGGGFTEAGGQPANYIGGATPVGPDITAQPTSQSVYTGQAVTFSVSASGTGPLTYEWHKDGIQLVDGGRISGATTDTLSINPVETADAGQYDAVVTDDCNSSGSALATLTILFRHGDLNCDGYVDFGDINPFVLALTNPFHYPDYFPNCDIYLADINGDGYVDFADINPFVALLTDPRH